MGIYSDTTSRYSRKGLVPIGINIMTLNMSPTLMI